jgi:hypothetical protein
MREVEVTSTADSIETLAQLIRTAVEIAENLTVADQQTRRELLDGLAIAQFNALRLAEDNNTLREFELRILQ